MLADCAAWDRGGVFDACTHLHSLMAGKGALAFARSWLADMALACRDAPLAQLPFRHSQGNGVGAIQLHRVGRVTLSVIGVDAKPAAPPRAISFTDCERHEAMLAGMGQATILGYRDETPPSQAPLALAPGARFSGDIDRSRAIVSVEAPLVFLRVAREPEHPELTREVEISTGRVLHRASACPSESRVELAAALLGAMGREDAAPALAAYACGQAGEGARWQALRHALALDTAAGFAALCGIADCCSDVLSREAARLRESLCTTYPQLTNMREDLCLAS